MIRLIVLGSALGITLAVFYFGGLWMTVRMIPKAARPRLLLLFSFFGRATVAVLCFYLVLQQGPFLFCPAALFFFVTRFVLTSIFGKTGKGRVYANQS